MDAAEWKARLEQLLRERKALDAFYVDLMKEMRERADAARRTGERPSIPAEVAALIPKLVTALETEREQSANAYALLNELVQALADLQGESPP